jgi:hypothetical protein
MLRYILSILKYHHRITLFLLQERRLAKIVISKVFRLLAATALPCQLFSLLLRPSLLSDRNCVILVVLSMAL